MIQAQLDYFKDISARVFIQYTNGRVDSSLQGTGKTQEIFQHCLRLHYLYAIIENARLSGTKVYIGDTEIVGSDIEQVYHKIWHYNGIFSAVDLSDYSDITADDGDGGITEPGDCESGVAEDHYRAGDQASTIGVNVVSFSTPLSGADYQITIYNTGASGYEQRNMVASTKTASGFVVNDVLEAGTLHYFAVIDL